MRHRWCRHHESPRARHSAATWRVGPRRRKPSVSLVPAVGYDARRVVSSRTFWTYDELDLAITQPLKDAGDILGVRILVMWWSETAGTCRSPTRTFSKQHEPTPQGLALCRYSAQVFHFGALASVAPGLPPVFARLTVMWCGTTASVSADAE